MPFAKCTTKVPAVLSHTNKAIAVDTVIEYKRSSFFNGEGHFVFNDGTSVPDIFFTKCKKPSIR